ncbi:hypothetical protein A3C28_00805 [Candidatus Roizmanbacteria bacterium RIFCSPHIGHO2_02_FULL_39_9]|uniref:ABC transmembrane type-2 domain-containing protein n=2 Tax=Candidatus Roizmaniibacteriota TaxID=1752723 RepID=A0A1F7I132_9BACT|nr:MAG: hypothetical protein A3C28_00805 [Candidatus Roizmanbacteria bacterium RIFCSPHIGHO2_02_FULL_39_9]OGK37093.1 MAG: hypothetical protein A3F60_02490 [Candidatus Roizmanbacteria bacterium RIFCSPHIGHO2_12_FULL_39_8]
MKLHRLIAINLRFFYNLRRSYDRLSDVFYWPALDLFIWGLTSSFFVSIAPEFPNLIFSILAGQILWIFLWRGQYEISVNLLEDLWNRNLINIFVSPLKFSEWIAALVIHGILKAFISFLFAALFAFFLYKTNIFSFGFSMIPFMILLIMTGWTIGFFVAALILRYGTKVQTLAWTLGGLFGPFSAIYYPVSILPDWGRFIAAFVPSSYVFEGMREVINKGQLNTHLLLVSFILNLIYLILALFFLSRSFRKVLEKGLVKVY